MRTTLRTRLLALLLAAGHMGVPHPAQAQATINTTTIAAQLTPSQLQVTLASGSTVVAGQFGYVDGELIRFQSAQGTSTTIWNILRGQSGTLADQHASGTLIFTGPGNYFAGSPNGPPVGPCTSTLEIALPLIDVRSGNIFDCKGATATTQVWVRYRTAGLSDTSPAFLPGPAEVPPTYTGAGALTIMPGISFLGSGGALAMTLANPTTAQNGMVMVIVAATAQAHTVTYTAGFGGGTTARDVATFGGAINDTLIIYAVNGVWWVWSTRNVTIA